MQAAVIQCAAVTVQRIICCFVVHIKRLINQLRLLQRELHLIDDQRLLHVFFQQLGLHRHQIADTEKAHLSGLLQRIECLCDLRRIKKQVGAVKQQRIEIIDAQSAQAVIDAREDVFLCPVEFLPFRADAAFALDIDVLTSETCQRECLGEAGFCGAVFAVAGCVVKEIDAAVKCRADDLCCFLSGERGHPHTTLNDRGYLLRSVCNIDIFHFFLLSKYLRRSAPASGDSLSVPHQPNSGPGIPFSGRSNILSYPSGRNI